MTSSVGPQRLWEFEEAARESAERWRFNGSEAHREEIEHERETDMEETRRAEWAEDPWSDAERLTADDESELQQFTAPSGAPAPAPRGAVMPPICS